MEIPDIAQLLEQKRKLNDEEDKLKGVDFGFFKSKGGEVEYTGRSGNFRNFAIKVGERTIKLSIFKDYKADIDDVDDYNLSFLDIKYDDPMFWDIFENGNEKYQLDKEVPEGFVFEIRNREFNFRYFLHYRDVKRELEFPCDDLEEKIQWMKKNIDDYDNLKKQLIQLFPKGRDREFMDNYLHFEVFARVEDWRYKAYFIKDFDEPLVVHEEFLQYDEVFRTEKTTVDGDKSLEFLISHVQKNLQKFEL